MNNEITTKIEQNKPYIHAVVGYVIEGDQVLLITRKKVSGNLGLGKMAGVGGKTDLGESSEVAFKRETMEEVGIEVLDMEYRGQVAFTYNNAPERNMLVDIFVCTSWGGTPSETEEGAVVPSWENIEELPVERMFSDNRYWVPQVLVGRSVNAFFVYEWGAERGPDQMQIEFY